MKPKFTLSKKTFILSFSLMLFFSSAFAQNVFEVTSPAGISGVYEMAAAGFGGDLPGCNDDTPVSGELIIVDDGTDPASDGCEAIQNDLTGKIALIDRGACEFGVKCLNAEDAGAMLVVVCNNSTDDIFSMGGGAVGDQVTIPALMISMVDCAAIRAEVPGATITISWETVIPSNDVVLWDGGQFDGGLGDWTTNAISPDTALWTWAPGGESDNGNVVYSPTLCNGAAVFDANVYNAAVSGGPAPYPYHVGELISPVIDCSSFTFVSLKFYTHNLRLNGDTDFSVSTDGGTTWSTPTVITTENVFTATETNRVGTEIKRYFISEFAGEANCRIKFTFNGDFYFFLLDDVQLIEPEANNLAITDNFYAIPPNAITPASQVEPFSFLADVGNLGGVAQPNTELNVSIVDNTTTQEVFNSTLAYGTVEPGTIVPNTPFTGYFTPDGTVTTYSGTYEVSSDSVDFDPSDNFKYFDFETSETTFAKETGMTRTIFPAANNWEGVGEVHSWAYGNFYHVVDGDDWHASSATFGLGNAADIPGILLTIYLYKWDQDTNEDGNMDPDERTRVAFSFYEIQGDELTTDLITVPLSNFPSGDPGPVDIESGQSYVLMVEYVANDDVTDMVLVASDEYDYGAMILRSELDGIPEGAARYAGMLGVNGDLDSEPYSSLGFGYDLVPVVRLNMDMVDNTDTPLDEANILEVSPNPANNKINLKIDLVETQENVNIRIFDVNGRLIMDQPYKDVKDTNMEFDVSAFTSGAYFLHFITEDGVRTERFIIQH